MRGGLALPVVYLAELYYTLHAVTENELRGKMIKYLILVLKGMAYGVTHVVPGLGGAMMLILLGIYGRFVESVGNLFIKRENWKQYLGFLVPVGVGMAIGTVVLAKLITVLLEGFPAVTQFFFMGLVVGTIPAVLRLHGDMRPTVGRIVALLAGIALVVAVRLVGGESGSQGTPVAITTIPGLIYNTVVSFFGGGASVTPGLDGSYVLLLGRTYGPVMEAVGNAPKLVLGMFRLEFPIEFWLVATLGVGALAGIITFSKLMDMALKHAPSVTYYAVLGLIVGSVYGLWPAVPAGTSLLLCGLGFLVGAGIALFFGRSPEAEEAAVEEQGAQVPS
jgi:putative membrane protein